MGRPATKKNIMEEAAIELFATRGLARTVIKDIALKAGVTEGALYKHYPGKNEMAWSLFCREVERFSSKFEKIIFSDDQTNKTRLGESIRYIYQYYYDHPIHFSFILLTQHGFPEEKLLDEKKNPTDMVIRFIKTVIWKDSPVIKDATLLAGMIMGLVMQPIIMHRYGRLPNNPLKSVDAVIEACKRLLEVY